jgi:prepilin-type N-terminal cleavage/methylation domain-containing protein/prepilin-type processing-associated H-X9-DG protein
VRNETSKRSGFTLVELLVVIGIIALLISILIPTLSRARQQATGIKCAAQMRGIGQQIMIYANNNKGWLYPVKMSTGTPPTTGNRGSGQPEDERWICFVFDDKMKDGTLNPQNHYSHEVMHCPADDRAIVDGGNADPYGSYHSYNYNMSSFPSGTSPKKWLVYGKAVPRLSYSDVCLMVEKQQTMHDWHMDIRTNKTDTQQQWYQPLFGQTVSGSFNPDSPGPGNAPKYKHGRYGNNYLFLDWSVRNDEPKMYDKANQWAPHDYWWEYPSHQPPG